MKFFLKNLAFGIPLSLGAVLTLVGTSMIVKSTELNQVITGGVLGIIGIPLLYAALVSTFKERAPSN